MDYVYLVASGFVIGLIVAVPIGPVNIICIRRTLAYGSVNGFVSGLGAALGDAIFAIVTGFGLTAIAQLIKGFSMWLELAGSAMLLIFGYRIYFAAPPSRVEDKVEGQGRSSLAAAMASTLALTVTNPATLLAFTALIAGFGGIAGARQPTFGSASFLVIGVAAGSTAWWLMLTTLVGLLHARIDDQVMRLINKTTGFAIAAFGAAVLTHLILKFT